MKVYDWGGVLHVCIENRFLNCIQKNFLTQHVDNNTHLRGNQSPTMIDLVISDDPDIISDISYNSPIGNSHHCVLNFNLHFNQSESYNENNNSSKVKYHYDKGDYDGMRNHFNSIDWSKQFIQGSDVNEWTQNLEDAISNAQNQFIPKSKLNINNTKINKPKRSFCASEGLMALLKHKRKAFKYFKRYPTNKNENIYHYYRNLVNVEVKKHKMLKEINIAKNVKSNPKQFYKYIKTKIKPKDGISNLIKEDNSYTSNDQEKADVLNNFFSSVFVEEGDEPIPDFKSNFKNELNFINITENDMLNVLNNLNISKSPGPDQIHPRILKELSKELSKPLLMLFNKTIQDGVLPKSWKDAEVKPIFKKGRKDLPGNYRPVSLTSILCKIFETFVRDALYDHLIDNSLLSDVQYGFCKKRSTVSQLLVTINEWLSYIDKKIPVDAAYLDFRKAFDSVPHQRLLSKLHGYGIRGKTYDWISSFLSERHQYVNINNNLSNRVPVTSGVPQGSVLGPVLFIYYINDLPDAVKCLLKLFADDSKAYMPILTASQHQILQESINNLVHWSDKWLIKFNSDKCKILHLGSNNPKHNYYIKNNNIHTILKETILERDLGVNIDPNLTFDKHITNIIKSARKMSGLLLRTITYKSPIILIPLYKSMVRTPMEHAGVVWAPYKRKHIDNIEKIQRHFTKYMFGMNKLTYHERLTKLKLPSLEFRRFRGDLIEAYKIIHHLYDPLTTKTLLTLDSQSITRSNGLKIKKNRVNHKQYQMFFTNRIQTHWNKLPRHIVNAKSLNQFKNKIDTHFKAIMYTTNLFTEYL